MTNIIQNIMIILGLVVVAGLGYYLFVMNTNDPKANDGFDDVSITSAQMLQQLYKIQEISINTDILDDQRFQELRSFKPPVVPVVVGNSNPFGQ